MKFSCPQCHEKTIAFGDKFLLGSGVNYQGKAWSFRPQVNCPECMQVVVHDATWGCFLMAFHVIFTSLVIFILLFPLAAFSGLFYLFTALLACILSYGLIKVFLVPLRKADNLFEDKIVTYLREFGLGKPNIVSVTTDPDDAANGEVIINLYGLKLRFQKEGAAEYMEFGTDDALFGDYFAYDDVFVAHDWLEREAIFERDSAIGLYEATRGLKAHFSDLKSAFSPENLSETRSKIERIRDERLEKQSWHQMKDAQ